LRSIFSTTVASLRSGPRRPGLNARTAGVYLRADPADLKVLDSGSDKERARLIAQRLREWKSAGSAY
jgi:hypothetical protein